MKLDLDCVRDSLLYLEENLIVGDDGFVKKLSLNKLCGGELGDKYERSTIIYTLQKLLEAGFITAVDLSSDNTFNLVFMGGNGITYSGHAYLDSVREKATWDKVRTALAKVGGSAPLSVVSALATEYLKGLLFPSA